MREFKEATVSTFIATTSARETQRRDFAPGETGRGPCVPSGGLANDPKAGQWDGRRMSKRMIADYKTFIVTYGEGGRNSLYVSGCPFHCIDCFSASIWDFQAGHEYTQRLEDIIIADLAQPWVQGITFLGGEPMLATPVLLPLAQRIRREYGHSKDIWCWTGYTWEELHREGETPDKLELLEFIDILVDGRFLKDQKDTLLQFRGSKNQRILDVPKSIAAGRPVVWAKLHDQERDIPEIYLKDRVAGESRQAS